MALCYRLTITLINIIFPPLAVMLLTGFGMDTLINCLLFLAAVLPSHIHGFYISCTYFARRRRVRKGRYPGGPKSFIVSDDVLNGGATPGEVRMLAGKRAEKQRGQRRRGGAGGSSRRGSRAASGRGEDAWEKGDGGGH